MAWRRCGNSPFYRNVDAGRTKYHSGFLDPVDLVLIRTAPQDRSVLLWRMQLIDFEIDAVAENFDKAKAALINAWFDRITDDPDAGAVGWKTGLLADLDVDPVQRDVLLEALKDLVALHIGRTEVARVDLPKSLETIEKTLHSYGVPAC